MHLSVRHPDEIPVIPPPNHWVRDQLAQAVQVFSVAEIACSGVSSPVGQVTLHRATQLLLGALVDWCMGWSFSESSLEGLGELLQRWWPPPLAAPLLPLLADDAKYLRALDWVDRVHLAGGRYELPEEDLPVLIEHVRRLLDFTIALAE